MTRIFFDFEFTGLHQETTPISLGIISDCDKTFYAEFSDYDRSQVDQWIEENVIKKLRFSPPPEGQQEHFMASRAQDNPAENDIYAGYSVELRGHKSDIKKELERWLNQFDRVEVWGDFLAYDWMLFCQIFGHAFNIPKNVYYIPFDLCTLLKSRGIDPDINREDFARGGECWYTEDQIQKHNALWDAKVIKACVDRIEKPLHQQQARKLDLYPRTSEQTMLARDVAPDEAVVFACFAGQLEREVAGLRWDLLDCRNKLNAAQAEINQLKAELREIANSCSQTNLEIEWCRSCTSKRWCVNGMNLPEASDGEQKASQTPRTDAVLSKFKYLNEHLQERTFDQVIISNEGLIELVCHARKSETELAEAQIGAKILVKKLKTEREYSAKQSELIQQMRNALSLISEGAIHGFHYVCQNRDTCLCLACQKKRVEAALAAEKSERA